MPQHSFSVATQVIYLLIVCDIGDQAKNADWSSTFRLVGLSRSLQLLDRIIKLRFVARYDRHAGLALNKLMGEGQADAG